jgi:hypothetical protein
VIFPISLAQRTLSLGPAGRPDGQVTPADLFQGRRQLIVQHVMFGPDWDEPCPGCPASIDAMSPAVLDHLGTRETAFVLASRALARAPATAAPPGSAAPVRSASLAPRCAALCKIAMGLTMGYPRTPSSTTIIDPRKRQAGEGTPR